MKTRKSTAGIVLRYARSTIATMSRTQGSVGLSSAEVEYFGMVSALAEAKKQVQEILGEYHEVTHNILETDSSAAKANVERLGCGRMNHISVKFRKKARRDLEPRSMFVKSWLETQCCRRFDKGSESTSAKEHVDDTEIELLETTHKLVSINLIVAKSIQNELMGEQKSTPGVNPSIGHMNLVKDEFGKLVLAS